jgi:hypothetical protein
MTEPQQQTPQQYDHTAKACIASGLYSYYVPTRRFRGVGITRGLQGWLIEEVLFAPMKVARQARQMIGAIDEPEDDDIGTRLITWLMFVQGLVLLGVWHGLRALTSQLVMIVSGFALVLAGSVSYLRLDPPATA